MIGPQRLSGRRLAELAEGLSPVDWALLHTLARVRLATADQLGRLHFHERPSANRQVRRQLDKLAGDRFVCRLPRRVGGIKAGSAGQVYALDVAGQRLVQPPTGSHPRRPYIPGPPFVAHVLAVSELFVGLTAAARTGDVDLLAFDAEPACWRAFSGPGGGRLRLKPDAFVRIGIGNYEYRWLVEVDRATEAPSVLHRKALLYVRYWQSGREQSRGNVFPKVLWVVPDAKRQEVLIDVLSRQAAEAWVLFAVTTSDQALEFLCRGQP